MKTKIIAFRNGFDGGNVAAVSVFKSKNTKTGDMVQIHILPVDKSPLEAARTKSGCTSTCGSCPLKKRLGANGKIQGACYVRIEQAQTAMYKAMMRGRYAQEFTADDFKDRFVRFGAYGCPTLLGETLTRAIADKSSGWTGYTHEWRKPAAQWARQYFMASCESERDRVIAKTKGWRTFRVKQADQPLMLHEIECPSEQGRTCAECRLCNGTTGDENSAYWPDIAINAHGAGKNHVKG